jgi:hypothetical protein
MLAKQCCVLLVTSAVIVASCTASQKEPEMTNAVPYDSDRVHLILHEEQSVYSIGEPFRPQLQIVNSTEQDIELGHYFVFDWQTLAFAEPNFVHLIGPDGTELALPHRRDDSYFSTAAPVRVQAGEEEWKYLPVYAHFHLREPGKYRFSLELLDNRGRSHSSNELSFELVDVAYSVSPEFVELATEPKQPSFEPVESVVVEAVFTNKFDQPLTFLKPQQDSFDGWANPVYQFTVTDSAGRGLALPLRSGTMAEPHYDASTQFTLEPGASYRQQLQLPSFPEMRFPGEYQVQLTYLVRREAIGKAGRVLDRQMDWPEEVFIGRLESDPLTLTLD